LASACHPKTLVSIRLHLNRQFGLDELLAGGMFGQPELLLLRQIVARHENFLIAGGAGAGKTTLLRAMLGACQGERVIAVEDVSEIGLESGHFISMQTRQANIEGAGEIGLDKLLREALRMRPDRLAVGEVRGAELLVMLQALNTGQRGWGHYPCEQFQQCAKPNRFDCLAMRNRCGGIDCPGKVGHRLADLCW
jgi:pilus assembly protein CpaF